MHQGMNKFDEQYENIRIKKLQKRLNAETQRRKDIQLTKYEFMLHVVLSCAVVQVYPDQK